MGTGDGKSAAKITQQREELAYNLPENKSSTPTETKNLEEETLEEKFNRILQDRETPLQIVEKGDIVWKKKEPLRFFQSLAFWTPSFYCYIFA